MKILWKLHKGGGWGSKKYYIRVRSYKAVKVNGKSTKVYSAWSKTYNVKVK